MRFLLDSDILSDLYEPTSPGHTAIAARLGALDDADSVHVSILALYELEYGYANAPDDRKAAIRQRISDLQSDLEVLPLTAEAARRFGTLKAGLKQLKSLSDRSSKSHNVDLMIAATALSEGCMLVSGDSIFDDVRQLDPDLAVENWFL